MQILHYLEVVHNKNVFNLARMSLGTFRIAAYQTDYTRFE